MRSIATVLAFAAVLWGTATADAQVYAPSAVAAGQVVSQLRLLKLSLAYALRQGLSEEDMASVNAIVDAFDKRHVSMLEASREISGTLSVDETRLALSLRREYHQREQPIVSSGAMGRPRYRFGNAWRPDDAGRFVLWLLGREDVLRTSR